MLQKELEKAGLTLAEAKTYLALLELGESNISRLSKKANNKRSTTYLIVDSLKLKGLVHSFKKKGRSVFYAEDPRLLEEKLEERKKAISKIMPELLSIANVIDKKPAIRFYEGKDDLRDLFKDILKYPDQEVLEWYSEKYATHFDEEFFSKYFTPKRIKNRIWARAILPDNDIIRKLIANNEKQLRQTKLLNPEKYHISIEMNVYAQNKISIISFEEEIGLIIESKKIHDSLKNLFELMWDMIK